MESEKVNRYFAGIGSTPHPHAVPANIGKASACITSWLRSLLYLHGAQMKNDRKILEKQRRH